MQNLTENAKKGFLSKLSVSNCFLVFVTVLFGVIILGILLSQEVKMEKKAYVIEGGVKPVGPYSLSCSAGDLLFISGQLPLDPETNEMVKGDFSALAKRAMDNLKWVLENSGSSLELVIKTTVFIRDMSKFSVFNEVYSGYFKDNFPARAVVEVSNLPKNGEVEIEAIAILRK